MYFLCLGHSHLGAIKFQYINGRAQGLYPDLEIDFIDLHQVTSHEYYAPLPDKLDDPILSAFEAITTARGCEPAAVFLSIGGSVQHNISMLNHQKPMDVITPWDASAATNKNVTLIPYRMMERLVVKQSNWKLNMLELISRHFSCPKYFFQVPPPIGSEEHLLRYPGPQFQNLVDERGFSPLPFRMKVAAIHNAVYKCQCEKLGVKYLAPPRKALDESGCLSVHASSEDSIHASVVYGTYLIGQVCDVKFELSVEAV